MSTVPRGVARVVRARRSVEGGGFAVRHPVGRPIGARGKEQQTPRVPRAT